jgi:hypothetical protein
MKLTKRQGELIKSDLDNSVFLEGAAGTGKTMVGVERLRHLLQTGVPGDQILALFPQRTLALPYYGLLEDATLGIGGMVNITTLGGLARRAVDLFWPLVARAHRFQNPHARPTFLSLETAQYFMARVVGPMIDEQGLFDTVTLDRSRLYSQIIDNLNKSAVVGFPYTEIGEKLKAAWSGDDTQLTMYDDVQECAGLFRDYCLRHNLLDFSLQVELFMQRLWPSAEYRNYLFPRSQHIIADNIEEDNPAAHTILADLLGEATSALVIYDSDAGYRRFLGADPDDGYARIRKGCQRQVVFGESMVASAEVAAFGVEVARSLGRSVPEIDVDPRAAIAYDDYRYHPEMIDGVAEAITALVDDRGVSPKEIVVLAPYLSDALRFSLMNRLQKQNIPVRSHRPSRSLREEPAAQCLLTLAQLAHPEWQMRPTGFDVVYMLLEAIDGLDLVRAQLLARLVFDAGELTEPLKPFDTVSATEQERITFFFGKSYEKLRAWLATYAEGEPMLLDHFFSKLFGEVLSQAGFGFHTDFDAAETAANLIDSAVKFRQMLEETGTTLTHKSPAREYVEMVGQGIIADQYLRGWDGADEDAVLLAPAYTFLLSNRPVDYQFWLNVGGRGWSERLYQPLTNPYVLTRDWPEQRKWMDYDEVEVARDALFRLTTGLVRRCRKQIYLGFSELGEQGYEQRGDLLQAVQRMLMRLADD